MRELIYFDNAATTYPKPERVYQVMDEVNRNMAVNAGRGSYALAQKASGLLTETRKLILKKVKANDVAEVVITASATLACNQILGGLSWKKTDVVYVSPYEHNAVMRTLYQLKERYGFRVEELSVNTRTLALDLSRIRYQFTACPPTVVILSHVSNVTGYILPVSEVLAVAEEYHPVTIIDASQAFCLVPIELRKEPIDYYIFAGHKTPYGPFGIGGFVNNRGRRLDTYFTGGTGSDSLNLGMPEEGSERYEPGSPNIVAAAGLKAALEDLEDKEDMEDMVSRERQLTEYLTEQLQEIPGVQMYLPDRKCHVGIVAFHVDGYQSQDVAVILDEDYHIAVRAGYHCAPLIHKYIQNVDGGGVVRVSLGRFTTKDEIDSLVRAVGEIAEG